MPDRDKLSPLIGVLIGANVLVVGLRTYVRISSRALGWDDYLLLVSLVGFILFGAMEIASVYYGIGATDTKPYYDAIKAAMYFTIGQIVYIITSGISKTAILMVLLRICKTADMSLIRKSIIVVIVISNLFSLGLMFVLALQCRPLSVSWGVGTGACISNSKIAEAGLVVSVEDVVVSWYSALLPVYLLWKTTLPKKVKLVVCILLGLGAVTSIVTIMRLKYIVMVQNISSSNGLAAAQTISTTVTSAIYSVLEIGLGIFTAALAALRPLLRKFKFLSDISSKGDSRPGAQSYNLHEFSQNKSNGGAIKLDGCETDDMDGDSERGIITANRLNSANEQVSPDGIHVTSSYHVHVMDKATTERSVV